jgi:hypothetical protein
MKFVMVGTVAAVGLLLASVPAAGQTPATPDNPLATVTELSCQFPAATSATWTDGEPETRPRQQNMRLQISAISIADGTAEIRGTAGRAYVTAVLSGWSLYFVETSVGQLNVTTVFAQEAAPNRLKAVHSRHGYLQMQVGNFIAEPSVSQNYGDCDIQE